jgi:aldehyde:ferredoxin oxidoreductase
MSMENEINGWVGKILKVDLSNRKTYEIPTMEYAKDFIGGLGIGMKILWDENPPDVEPLDPENRLVFMTGPVTGTLAPTSGRIEVCTKAAGTVPPMCTRSGIGGYWGPELKFAGYDGVVIYGKSDKPAYIFIADNNVQILDAGELWGMDTFAVQKEIMRRHGQEVKTLCIGPAGENLVKLATIQSDTGYSASKIGGGAVMGSKNLKAISVKGTGGVNIARIPEFVETSRRCWEYLHNNPVRHYTTEGPMNKCLDYAVKYRKKFVSCFGCPANCRAWIEYPGLPGGESMCAGGWWYLIIGSKDDRAIWEAKCLADQYGLCAHTMLDIVWWFNDSFKAGLISEEEMGIPFSTFGSSEYVNKLLHMVTYREGFGDIIAGGPTNIKEHIAPEAAKNFGYYFPAYGQGEHYELRAYPVFLMQWVFDSRDPLIDAHDWSTIMKWQHWTWPASQVGRLSEDQVLTIGKEVYGSEKAFSPHSYEYKAETVAKIQNMSRLKNSMVVCDWLFPLLSSHNNAPTYKADPDIERKMFCAATGVDYDAKEWDKAGERIYNLERALLIRDNQRTRDDDTVDSFHFEVPVTRLPRVEPPVDPPPTADRVKLEETKNIYFKLRGWDEKTGRPTRDKLIELGLGKIADELQKTSSMPE